MELSEAQRDALSELSKAKDSLLILHDVLSAPEHRISDDNPEVKEWTIARWRRQLQIAEQKYAAAEKHARDVGVDNAAIQKIASTTARWK
jgi:hypothetical protein